MKLYCTAASPFSRKVRILVREMGLEKNVEEIAARPSTSEELPRVNPLGKIPALILDDGSALMDSRVICEYLNDLGGGKFFPGASLFSQHNRRWKALMLQALGDGLCDAAVAYVYERIRPAELQSGDTKARYLAAVTRTLDVLEGASAKFAEFPTIGEVAIGCGLGYLDFREVVPDWRNGRPALAAWFETFSQYPSVIATRPQA